MGWRPRHGTPSPQGSNQTAHHLKQTQDFEDLHAIQIGLHSPNIHEF